jgi:zinc-ribbon domain
VSRLSQLAKRPAAALRRPAPPEKTAPSAALPNDDKAKDAAGIPKPEERAELVAQRDRLLEKFTVMQADLGGAFYEMAIRDHVRLDVLTRKAAELQRVDAELVAIERVLELERSDAAGLCPSCGAPYGHGVRFCAQCGHSLVPTAGTPK